MGSLAAASASFRHVAPPGRPSRRHVSSRQGPGPSPPSAPRIGVCPTRRRLSGLARTLCLAGGGRRRAAASASASGLGGVPSLSDLQAVEVMGEGHLCELPKAPGVYAVYSHEGKLQYIGLSKRVSSSIFGHMQDLPDLVWSVKTAEVPSGDKDSLMGAWKAWVQETVITTGAVPPGNAPGIKDWSQGGTRTIKPEIRLTAGSGAEDVTLPIEDLIQNVVTSYKVVAFIKGTRTDPACGFSFKVLSILNGLSTDYELVNVLDEVHNPGLRDAIKNFSMWPTIPQLYVGGEFVGGADVVVEMSENGELATLLQ